MSDTEALRLHVQRQRDRLIDIIDSEFGLLSIFLENQVLSNREIGDIKSEKTNHRKNEMLLNIISENDKHEDFIAALEQSSQNHVVNWIIADGKFRDEFGLDWPLTDKENETLNKNQRTLVEILDTCDLLNRLYSKKVINKWHKELIESKPTDHDKNDALLDIVRRLSRKGYSILIICLRDSNQGHIADIFEFGGVIVPLHATLQGDNLDEAETQIVNRLVEELCSNTRSMDHANRLLAEVQLQVIAAKRGQSIVLYVKCCNEDELSNLRKVVENMELKGTLERLFNLLLRNITIKVLVVKIFETDLAKAMEAFALHREMNVMATFRCETFDKGEIERLRDLTECSICLMTYTNPRMLPCFHSACLKCFEDMQEKNAKKLGDVLPCPLCRTEFSIPLQGMTGFQENVFIESIVDLTQAIHVLNKSIDCNVCVERSEVTDAKTRCLDCCKNYCLKCSEINKSEKLTRDHKLVELKTEFDEEEIRSMYPIRRCKKHSDRMLAHYCSDCKAAVCVACVVEDHHNHKCIDANTFDREFCQRLEGSVQKMSEYRHQILSVKSDIERQECEFLENTLETEKSIKRKNQELKDLIDQHTQTVLDELCLLKEKRQKQLETEMAEINKKIAVLESFVTYCNELRTKGSSSDVCRINARDLIERAEELGKGNETYLSYGRPSVCVEFTATEENALLQNVCNVIGKVSESACDSKFENFFFITSANIGYSSSRNVIKINLNKPDDVSSMQPIPSDIQWGVAAAVGCNSIFVTGTGKNYNEIWKFGSTSRNWIKCAYLNQGRGYHSVAFVNRILYVCSGRLNNSGNTLDDVEAYDAINDNCTTVGKLLYPVTDGGNCVSYKGSLYFFDACNDNDRIDSSAGCTKVQVYDTKLNVCTLLPSEIPREDCFLRAVLWENIVILLGSSTGFLFHLDSGTWQVRDQFKVDDVHFGLKICKEKLFVIGGVSKWASSEKSDVRWIPVENILKEEPIEWTHHARLPNSLFVYNLM